MESFPYPLGPSKIGNGVNFALYAPLAQEVTIIFSDKNESHPLINKTGEVWHIYFKDLALPVKYQYKVDDKVMIDPFAPSLASRHEWGEKIWEGHSVLAPSDFDWEGIKSPNLPIESLVIYEMHVRGFTKDPRSHVSEPGTFLGIIEKIPYLIDLGINCIELLPITEFLETEYNKTNPLTKEQLYNYWGYSPMTFMSPMNRYGVEDTEYELKLLVRELHRFGIEVILDLVYNHTYAKEKNLYNELAPETYYVIENDHYNNDSGCGNTFNTEHPVTQELVMNSLRRFAHEFHIDGFRFDLATVMKRTSDSLVNLISQDPVLKNCKMIAEPWDLARYQVGNFYTKETRWSEWNDKYRDTVRSFMKGDPSKKGEFASRLAGSQDIYGTWGLPSSSINFITAHDGFTLYDLVSYNDKHNQSNGEKNRDGGNSNFSWNCGKEGPTENRGVNALREKQMRNFFLALLMSKGVPMIHMGDEYGHTKIGNNNTWCQDNKLSWFDWKLSEERGALFYVVKNLIAIRKNEPILQDPQFLTPEDVEWHGVNPHDPQWEVDNKFLAYTLKNTLWIGFNASNTALNVKLPEGNWSILFHSDAAAPKIENNQVLMEAYTSLLLKAKP